uniref:Fibrinogen C-terminal domain-containing protein n=2 Tax=Magallana gigas TaxID=29159 RepID=A0A8W8JSC3_MAGGI
MLCLLSVELVPNRKKMGCDKCCVKVYKAWECGESLYYSNNMMFSTLDQDNDGKSSGSCATMYRTAGWCNIFFYANPNGEYADSEKTGPKYITWTHWKNSWISLKSIQMMIRPRA